MTDKAKVTVASGVITLSCLLFLWQRQHAPEATQPAHVVSTSGLAENDTGGTVLGNPENAIADFKEIYAVIDKYGEFTNGAFPNNTGDFYHVNGGLKAFGYANPDDFLRIFFNPDHRYSDSPADRQSPDNIVSYQFGQHHTASNTPQNRATNRQDVLLWSSLYVHQNSVTAPNGKSTVNPVGFYIVLWGDGRVEKVPHDKVVYVGRGKGDYTVAFPGQADLPRTALSYDAYYHKTGWAKGPRGHQGGSGIAYNDTH